MVLFLNAKLRVFSKPEDDYNSVLQGLRTLSGLDWEALKIKPKITIAKGFEDKTIKILELSINKKKLVSSFVNNLLSHLSKTDIALLEKQISSRIDENCNFYIRLDKKALQKGSWIIIEGGDCYHVKINLGVYPNNKSKAVQELKLFLQGFVNEH
ncbi:hypothetical protein J7L02_02800 [Candidatus Woesearchaeota archaeon]|nr:hypothetical protein [Candidatus Woesearchaeota archaeon]